jgi:hypothetical protein
MATKCQLAATAVTANAINRCRVSRPSAARQGDISGILARAVLARGGPCGASGQVQRAGGAAVYRVGSQPVCHAVFDSAPGIKRARPNEGIALSQHRTGARSSRRKRGLFRRFGIVFPAAVIAAIAVIAVAVGAVVFAPGSGAFSAAEAIEAVPGSPPWPCSRPSASS